MKLTIRFFTALCFFFGVLYACTKDKGRNPALAYTDFGLYDSCTSSGAFVYYKNDESIVYSGSNGPHGTFKLKFNHKANAQLLDAGKLPVGASFTDGSMVVKEIISGGKVTEYAMMYKLKGSWIWAEFNSDRSVKHSVKANNSLCTSCHSQAGNRDLVNTFYFH